MKPLRHVVFKCPSFNTSIRRDFYINDQCYGDDLARALVCGLRERGVRVDDEIGQEDFGWYVNFYAGKVKCCAIIVFQPGRDESKGEWTCSIERIAGVIGFLMGRAKKNIPSLATHLVHEVVSSFVDVSEIRWYADGDFEMGVNPNFNP